MAIILKCSKCREHLEVDDAFAGGVCRCVHCGALSQVPLQPTTLDRQGRPVSPPEMAKPVVALPEAELTLRIAPTRRYAAQTRRLGILAVILMLASLAMIVLIIMLMVSYFRAAQTPPAGSNSQNGSSPTPSSSAPTGQQPQPPGNPIRDATGPAFLGLAMPDGKFAFLLNVGNSMQDSLDPATRAIEECVKRLGDRQFTIIPWRKGNADVASPSPQFPATGLAKADRQAAGLADWFGRMESRDARDTPVAVGEAVTRGATVLLVITRNDLDATEVDAMRAKAEGKNVIWLAAVIDALPGGIDQYPQLARLTGGKEKLKIVRTSDIQTWLQELPAGLQ